ncbi:hypothetical protein [Streptomyces sp. BE147]|nr:hypothetical protein [Streptomyces sp. BE147]
MSWVFWGLGGVVFCWGWLCGGCVFLFLWCCVFWGGVFCWVGCMGVFWFF